MATSLTWLADEVNRGERQALGDLYRIASEGLEVARLTASASWFADAVSDDMLIVLGRLKSIVSLDIELARLIASVPWFSEDLTSNQLYALRSLHRIAESDVELARLLAGFPLFADGQDRDLHAYALISLGGMAISAPHDLDRLSAQPWFADGLDDHEAALVTALNVPSPQDQNLYEDLLQAHFMKTNNVSLPLAGAVNIWVIQNVPFPPDDDLLTVIEDAARISEAFMKVPFPTTDIILLVVVEDDPKTYTTEAHHFQSGMVLTRSRDGEVAGVVPHETAHYYFYVEIGPLWLQEGGAQFIASYFNDWNGVQELADRATWIMNVGLPCTLDGVVVESLHHLNNMLLNYQLTGCHYSMGENFLLNAYMTLGGEAMSSAMRDLYLSTTKYRPHSEKAIYDAFLKHAPVDRKKVFRDLYRSLHGGPYAYPNTSFSDDHGDDATNASAIGTGEIVHGVLDYRFDFDYFRFRALEGQKYRMDVNHESLHSASVTLYTADGQLKPQNESWISRRRAQSGPQILWIAPSSGEYYLVVQNFGGKTGTYTLTITPVDN